MLQSTGLLFCYCPCTVTLVYELERLTGTRQLGRFHLTNSLNPRYNTQRFQTALLRHEKDWNNIKGTRRGRLDITAEILLFCEQPKTKTSIMYNTNLNYAQLKRHMSVLTTQKLLAKKTNMYATTEKGHEFLNLFTRLSSLVDSLDP